MVRGGGYKLNEPAEIVHEKVIFSGYFVKHWGHFLVDCIGRFWPLCDKKFDSYKVVFLTHKFSPIEGNYLEFLSYLGISKDRLINVKVPAQFDEVLIPSVSYDAHGNFSPEHRKMIELVVKNSKFEDVTVPPKVYLTRRKFTYAQRKEVGEKDIEAVFAANGYTVLSPERLTLREQIALFQKSDEIVCLNGTIPLNIFFARPELKLVVLNKANFVDGALLEACNFSEVEPIYIDAWYKPFKRLRINIGQGPFWLVITENLIRFLHDNNLNADIKIHNSIMKRIADWSSYLRCCVIAYAKTTPVWEILRYIKNRIKYH